jgi:hypothetical protein
MAAHALQVPRIYLVRFTVSASRLCVATSTIVSFALIRSCCESALRPARVRGIATLGELCAGAV